MPVLLRRQYYQDNKDGINGSNLASVRLFCLVNVPVSILNVFIQEAEGTAAALSIWMAVYAAVIEILVRRLLKDSFSHATLLLYLLELPTIVGSVMNGTILDPDHQAFSFLLFGILMPVMILDHPLRVIGCQAACSVLMICLSVSCKTPDLIRLDIIHVTEAMLIGCSIVLVVISSRMKELDRGRRAEIAAMKDTLTGLGNRKQFHRNSGMVMDRTVAIVCFVVDSCEIVNDMFGHDVGDALLVKFAACLKHHFGEDDSYRWAGSVFFVMMSGKHNIRVKLQGEIDQCLEDFAETEAEGIHLQPQISAGYVVDVPGDRAHLKDMMRLADLRSRQSRYSTAGRVVGGEFDSSMLTRQVITDIMVRYQDAASRDELTGMMRVTPFVTMCETLIGQKMIRNESICILYVNVIGMKNYNEKYGFTAGDGLIRDIASLIGKHLPGRAAARTGGDHFIIFAYSAEAQKAVFSIDEELQTMYMNHPVRIKAGQYDLKKRDSVALACDRAKTAEDSIKGTDRLLCVYDDALEEKIRMEQFLTGNLRGAISAGHIVPFYQPIYEAQSGKLCACEALARWIDPEIGMISPGVFIPVLENTGMITELDLAIIDQVIGSMAVRLKKGELPLPVSVNLSRFDLGDPAIVDRIAEKVDSAGLDHHLLVIEITESAFEGEGRSERINEMVRAFQMRGFQVWMDDFGSGYSSLNMLEGTSFNLIKLDMKFMRAKNAQRGMVLVREIIHMANALGIDTLVEGVETEEQVRSLRQIGCGRIQGFYYSKPLPEAELEKLLFMPSVFR